MYITINDVIGEKTIDLSYPIHNCDSRKESAIITILSDNLQYEIKEPLKLSLMGGSERQILGGTYTLRELSAFAERKFILTNLNNNPRIIKTSNLERITDMIFNLDELIILITSKMADPATPYLHIMWLILKILCILSQQPPI